MREPKQPSSVMEWLVDFLNSKLDSPMREEWLNQLSPLWDANGKIDEQVFLDTLVTKINEWASEELSHVGLQWRLRRAEEARGYTDSNQTVLRIGKGRFVVDLWPTYAHKEDVIYIYVAKLLESGEISRLKRCPNCQCFFFAHHLGQDYCGPEHQKVRDDKEAALRMKRLRRRQAKEAKKIGLPLLVKIVNGQVSKMREIFDERFDEFLPFAEGIRNGEEPAKVWASLPPRLKRSLR